MQNDFFCWMRSLWAHSLEIKLRRESGSVIKVTDDPKTMMTEHIKNIKQNRYENNTINLKQNL